MTTTKQSTEEILEREDYNLCITIVLVEYLCSPSFQEEDLEVRQRTCRHFLRCFDGLWA